MSIAFFAMGVFGLLGLSYLCPTVAYLIHQMFYPKDAGSIQQKPSAMPQAVEITVPAHNESMTIGPTLQSIQESIEETKVQELPVAITIHVVADGCTDRTADVARGCRSVVVSETVRKGKWRTLSERAMATNAEWVIFVDAGVRWPEQFLVDYLRTMTIESNLLGISPAYRPVRPSWVARNLWRLETALKRTEAKAGGPISVHGATVAYPAGLLKEALLRLGDAAWLNDDVVIPLTLRALHPEGRILYPVGLIEDAEVVQTRSDWHRRRRILVGNVQWMTTLLPFCFKHNRVAALIAMRRVFRLVWGYWIMFLLIGLALLSRRYLGVELVVGAFLLLISGSARQLAGAGIVSLLSPLLLWRRSSQSVGAWK